MKKQYSVYVKTGCPYCKSAISLLEQKDLPFIVIVVDKNLQFLEEIKQQTKHTTVPIILEHTETGIRLIGGFDQLEKHLSSVEILND